MTASTGRPVFIFDGDCGICREWVDYWRAYCGARFDFRPYQEALADHPQLLQEACARAVQLVRPDGSRCSGAEATFALYAGRFPQGLLPWLYRRLPAFAGLSERAYRFFAERRGLLAALTHFCWGRGFRPVRFELCAWLFLRLLGLIYFSAFVSFGVQARGLVGAEGLLPLGLYQAALAERFGAAAWLQFPSVFWLHAGDAALLAVSGTGALLALLLAADRLTRTVLPLLFLLYLSVYYAGQTFMSFQWDLLLLEAGMLALFLPRGAAVAAWAYRWLLFRFMFLGGMVKLLSGDPTWDNLSALQYHFETQPLPTLAAWYAHRLPDGVLAAATAATLIIEIVLAFLLFAPRRLRMFAGGCFILLQFAIVLTGNYNFFNLLTLALCLFLFDDAALERFLPRRLLKVAAPRLPAASRAGLAAAAAALVLALLVGGEGMLQLFSGRGTHEPSLLMRGLRPCACVNNYGPFAVMTRVRHEIVIEGTLDGSNWREYEFRYKPGDPARIGGWIIPHQPRLDWQMWFAALSPPERQPWLRMLLARLLTGSAPVLDLLAADPFAGAQPRAVRAQFYRYRFSTAEERRASGDWWRRTLVAEYHPPISLRREADAEARR